MSQTPPGYPSWQKGPENAEAYNDNSDRGLLSNILGGSTSGQQYWNQGQQYGNQGCPLQQGSGGYHGQPQPGYGQPGYNQAGNAPPQGYTSPGYAPTSGAYGGQGLNTQQGQPYAPPQQGSGGYFGPTQQNAPSTQSQHHNLAGPALAGLGGAAVGMFAEHEHDKHHHHRH